MDAETKEFYDMAFDMLQDAGSASYNQVTGGTYNVATSEVTATTNTSTPIKCYKSKPQIKDIEMGLASISDVKIIVSAKALGTIIPKIDDTIVFTNETFTVKVISPTNSAENIAVKYDLFCSKMA